MSTIQRLETPHHISAGGPITKDIVLLTGVSGPVTKDTAMTMIVCSLITKATSFITYPNDLELDLWHQQLRG